MTQFCRGLVCLAALLCASLPAQAKKAPEYDFASVSAANRYIAATGGVEALFEQALAAMKRTIPAPQAKMIRERVLTPENLPRLEMIMQKSLLRHLTREELIALAVFFERPVGRSIAGKMPLVMGDMGKEFHGVIMKNLMQSMREP